MKNLVQTILILLPLTAFIGCDQPDASKVELEAKNAQGTKEPSATAKPTDAKPVAPDATKSTEVRFRKMLTSPLTVAVPSNWIFENTRPGPPKDDDSIAPDAPIKLRSRTLFSSRASKKEGAAWFMVMHDNNLPLNATASDYLDAQRKTNRQTVVNIKHVDAERSTLNGRSTYRLRDEWELNGDPYVQDSLLIVDHKKGAKTKDGYIVVMTQPRADAAGNRELVQKIMKSVTIDGQPEPPTGK